MKKQLTLYVVLFLFFLLSFSTRAENVYTLGIDQQGFKKLPAAGELPASVILMTPADQPTRTVPALDESVGALNEAIPFESPSPFELFQTKLERSCELRTRPTDNSAAVKVLPKGTEVTAQQFNKAWLKIGEAYMAGTCLR